MSNPLVIRADANTCMGTGHVMRCIALGQAWKRAGGEVFFVSCCASGSITERIAEEGFFLVELGQAYPESENDLNTTMQTARKLGASWIITDGYHFDLGYQRTVRQSGFKLLCVDDYNHLKEYEADILLNQNVGAEELEYQCNAECRKLLGPRHVMLRKEFHSQEKVKRSFPETGRNLLVTLGGSDPGNVSLKVIEALEQLDISDLDVKIIVGPANPHLDSLQKVVDESMIHCELIASVRYMSELMHWADVAISAAGSTCWELCLTGVPFLIVVVAENQRQVAASLSDLGITVNLGDGDKIEPFEIAGELRSLLSNRLTRERMSAAGGRLIDGFGADRVLGYLAKTCGLDWFSGRLVVRRMVEQDSETLFAWINDPQTRNNSFNTTGVEWDTHVEWFKQRMDSSESLLLVAELDGIPCGHVRYEKQADAQVLLSFLVGDDFRGLGLACPIILHSFDLVVEKFGGIEVLAYSLQANIRSHKAMLNAGFRIVREECSFMDTQCCEFITTLGRKSSV
jgi:UDP-2,4-diacetamido-2,4,6-trideoxy-beta-L-altropyranose hydrolase